MSTDQAQRTISVIGLGAMGLPVARNLAGDDVTVVGCDPSPERRALFDHDGVATVAKPADLPVQSSVFFVLLPNPAITEQALFGDDGLVATSGLIGDGDIVINLGTIGPDAVVEFDKRLSERGCALLDVPMGKSSAAAESADLSLMAAGNETTIARVRPLLDRIASEVVLCGEVGIASTIKIVNNLVSSTISDVVGQALTLGVAAGAPPDLMIKSMMAAGADNWHLRNTYQHKVSQRDFDPGFSIDLATKDMRIGLDMAATRQISLPTVSQAYQRYLQAQKQGYGNEDWGALAKVAENSAGISLTA